jgi:hypothetical protein
VVLTKRRLSGVHIEGLRLGPEFEPMDAVSLALAE